ncbi:parathyroid hormone/parathyroid hormone-related peptide receptor-like [Aethina tumida]|uniref:parathyroid hormone/parathyroid hormone-related peptide receptor-like n=1 Tax=Aethina tumida TaxID=116153 RepID=UPI0021483090|nr:parathyroid hormone/parathyroid hormone-related peptide receptor-like [Aethina tumida]XP_049822281.1 parathyroid hormone/parathyroid hormone-related peptide receptor-like [Aethina tumida]
MLKNAEWALEEARNKCMANSDGGGLIGKCASVWDGLMCWPDTKSGETAYQNCTNDYVKSKVQAEASKYCTQNGTWYKNPVTNNYYTNYTLCGFMYFEYKEQVDFNEIKYNKWLPVIKNISYFGYTLSIVSLIISIVIFITIKRLHCQRNKLHIHLFISFLLKGVMFFIKDFLFVQGTALTDEVHYENGAAEFTKTNYSWICKAIISIRYYFIMCNFMMVLMEGMYLHNLMFLNLFSENNVVGVYYGVGWIVPVVFIVSWVVMQTIYDDTMCWTKKNRLSMLINVPIGVSVVINFILFILIVRVLFLKLNMICIQQRKIKYRKLLKSTLILIPLFGIPYFMSFCLQFWIDESPTLELIWLLFDQSFSAFQGFFASLVYCLLNCEVQAELRRKYFSLRDITHREFRRSRTISHTQQFTLNPNEENMESLRYFGNNDEVVRKTSANYYF